MDWAVDRKLVLELEGLKTTGGDIRDAIGGGKAKRSWGALSRLDVLCVQLVMHTEASACDAGDSRLVGKVQEACKCVAGTLYVHCRRGPPSRF